MAARADALEALDSGGAEPSKALKLVLYGRKVTETGFLQHVELGERLFLRRGGHHALLCVEFLGFWKCYEGATLREATIDCTVRSTG